MENSKIDRIIEVFRMNIYYKIDEDSAPTMNLGAGQIAGTVEAGDDPPVDLRKKNKWNIFFKNMVRRRRKNK